VSRVLRPARHIIAHFVSRQLLALVLTTRRRSVVVSALASINVVNRHWARLLLGWVTAHGQVNRLDI